LPRKFPLPRHKTGLGKNHPFRVWDDDSGSPTVVKTNATTNYDARSKFAAEEDG
jgi:hypothetical protein